MFFLTAKKHGSLEEYLYICRAEISAAFATMGRVCPFLAIK